jgi:hypothetical protein
MAVSAMLLLPLGLVEEVEGQWRAQSPFSRFITEEAHPFQLNPSFLGSEQEERQTADRSFLRRVAMGSLAGLVSGAFLGSLISDWSLPGGAGLGLATGTATGLVVAVAAENVSMTKWRGFLIGAVPAYATWLLVGAPVDFVLDPLFLFGIPGWFSGKGRQLEADGGNGAPSPHRW